MQATPSDDTRTDFGLLFAQAFNAYVEHLHEGLAQSGFPDLRPTFGLPLRALHRRPRTLTELAAALGVTKQAAAKIVAQMEELGLVERRESPDDRRATILRLSRRGRSLVARAVAIGGEVEAGIARDLGPDAAAGLRAALERMARAVRPVGLGGSGDAPARHVVADRAGADGGRAGHRGAGGGRGRGRRLPVPALRLPLGRPGRGQRRAAPGGSARRCVRRQPVRAEPGAGRPGPGGRVRRGDRR